MRRSFTAPLWGAPFLLVLASSLAGLLTPVTGLMAQAARSVPRETPDSAITIEGIVVTATPVPVAREDLGSHVSVLDGGALRERGVTRVSDALRDLTGVSLAQSGSFGSQTSMFVRGGESDYVLVLLDGVPLNDPGGAVDLAGLTTENIDRIEIVRGPVSGLYGSDAVSGVVQIITRSGSSGFSGSGTIRGGSFGSVDGVLDLSGGNESGSFSLSAGRYATDGVLPLNNGHRNSVLSGRADLRLDEDLTARVTARLLDRTYRFPTDDAGNPVDTNQFTFSQDAVVGVEVDRKVGDAFDVRGLVTLHDLDSGTDDAPDGPSDNAGFFAFQSLDALRRVTADLRGNLHLSEVASLTAGAEVERERVRSFSESLSEYGSSVGRSTNSRQNVAGYAHAVTSLGKVALNGGVRVEDNEQFGRFLSFQLGSSMQIRPGTYIRFAGGRGVKEPTFFEAYATGFAVGNPDLEPERSTSWEIGLEREIHGGLRAGVTWFDQSFRNLIQYTSSPPELGGPNFFNVAAADARGLELEVAGPVGPVTVSTGWTWLDTEVTDSGFDEGPSAMFVEGEPLIRRPRNTASLGLHGDAGARVRWNADLRWVGRRSDRNFNVFPAERITLDSYVVLNAGVEATLLHPVSGHPGLDLLLRAENLGGTRYEEVFGFDAPGRGLYVGGRVVWGDR